MTTRQGLGTRVALAVCTAALATSAWGQALPACTPITFETGTTEGFATTGLWHASTACGANAGAHTTPNVLYYGIDGQCNFDNGATNSGNADSPPINVFGASQLRFNHRQSSEDGSEYDMSTVEYSTDGGGSWLPLIGPEDLSRDGNWHAVTADFPPLGVPTVMLRFRFASIDDISNDGLGWMVDDIQICQLPGLAVPASNTGTLALMAVLLMLAGLGALRLRR